MSEVRITFSRPSTPTPATVTIRANSYRPRPTMPNFHVQRDLYEDRIILSADMSRNTTAGSYSTAATIGSALSPQISPMSMLPVLGLYSEHVLESSPAAQTQPAPGPVKFFRAKKYAAKACCKVLGKKMTHKLIPGLRPFIVA